MISEYTADIINSYRKITGNTDLSVTDYLAIRDQSIKELSLGFSLSGTGFGSGQVNNAEPLPQETQEQKKPAGRRRKNDIESANTVQTTPEPAMTQNVQENIADQTINTQQKPISDFDLLRKINDPWQ